jgi:hypothetical protein
MVPREPSLIGLVASEEVHFVEASSESGRETIEDGSVGAPAGLAPLAELSVLRRY